MNNNYASSTLPIWSLTKTFKSANKINVYINICAFTFSPFRPLKLHQMSQLCQLFPVLQQSALTVTWHWDKEYNHPVQHTVYNLQIIYNKIYYGNYIKRTCDPLVSINSKIKKICRLQYNNISKVYNNISKLIPEHSRYG